MPTAHFIRPFILCVTLAWLVAPSPAQAIDGPLRKSLAWQIALESRGFSPGIIDGKPGPRTEAATRLFQAGTGLPVTGKLDERTAAALQLEKEAVVCSYVIEPADIQSVTGMSSDWNERSRMAKLGYSSLAELLAERFHCTTALLKQLNPGTIIDSRTAGQSITGLAITLRPIAAAGSLEISLSRKTITALRDGKPVALMHCSIAADKAKRPSGQTTITTIVENPSYTFDPKHWPEVKNVDRRLIIAPGPRNPVGVRWIGLALDGYGIHGTPWPEQIGKTGSHGCFRLTNWDATRLAGIVQAGTSVKISE
jgi:lipoprotein-anchoring transpeptidase ErfK/SrfK